MTGFSFCEVVQKPLSTIELHLTAGLIQLTKPFSWKDREISLPLQNVIVAFLWCFPPLRDKTDIMVKAKLGMGQGQPLYQHSPVVKHK